VVNVALGRLQIREALAQLPAADRAILRRSYYQGSTTPLSRDCTTLCSRCDAHCRKWRSRTAGSASSSARCRRFPDGLVLARACDQAVRRRRFDPALLGASQVSPQAGIDRGSPDDRVRHSGGRPLDRAPNRLEYQQIRAQRARRYRAVHIRAGRQTLTAADSLPDDVSEGIAAIHSPVHVQ
jgi:hypothetical protein